MAVFWFGGPNAGRGDWMPGQVMGAGPSVTNASLGSTMPQTSQQAAGLQSYSGPNIGGRIVPPRPPGFMGQVGGSASGGGRGLTAPAGLNFNFNTVGSTTAGGAPGGVNPLEDLLRDRLRRIRTEGAGERRDITDRGIEQGLGRSQGAAMEHQRQREQGAMSDAERQFQAGEFENQRAQQGQQLQAQLERERMQQEMALAQQRADLERELAQQRLDYGGGGGEGGTTYKMGPSSPSRMQGGGGGGYTVASQQETAPNWFTQPFRRNALPPLGQAVGANLARQM